ncbi:MAG TPA: type IV toxin-antitoxin system AbiEi family antitoxin, partial [Thermoplasmata archaeon]|nr:type IV toxin-antitoxin system AbiEi family antitoxin [Thermoplasmata archaeon]
METRTLSRKEAQVILGLLAEGKIELALGDIERIAAVTPVHSRKLAHVLRRKGWIQKIGAGRFLINPPQNGPDAIPDSDPLRIGSRLVSPYYLGFGTAANLHGLLSSYGTTYYVVTPGPRHRLPTEPVEFKLVRTEPDRFFGMVKKERHETAYVISDLERTVIDCLRRPDYCGGIPGVVEIVARARKRWSTRKLLAYLARFGDRSLMQRLGYLLDRLGGNDRPTRDL